MHINFTKILILPSNPNDKLDKNQKIR